MTKFSTKLRYFVAGFLAATILSTGIAVMANPEMRQLFFGVNVVIGDRALELDGINRPFIMDGRTFLPVSAIADALGIPIEWDGDTSTVYIGYRSSIVGHWELVRISGVSDRKFVEDVGRYGSLELIFYPDGRLDYIDDVFSISDRWHHLWGGHIIINDISHWHYEVSEPYLTIRNIYNFEYTVYRRIN
ncbi:MAG: copper amine oxidase N-terminal domain-containing protein [Defluviitaleaceae bacterium]|nr:copper amine oxidase N-terminal domain-containing protein [Defluviitaleaceae bacterium]